MTFLITKLLDLKCNQPFFWNVRSPWQAWYPDFNRDLPGRDRTALIAGSENVVPEKTGW